MTHYASVSAMYKHILITSLLSFSLASSLTCYWPNGETANDAVYKPCSINGGTCCYDLDANHTDLCYDNGMCYSLFWGRKYRGACTDVNWSAGSGCAQECLTFEPGDSAALADCADASTCCGYADNATSCCADGGGFYWDNSTFILQRASAVATTTLTVTERAVQATPASAQSSLTSSNPTDTASAAALQLATTQCNKDKTALGAGLGVPLGMSLLLAAALGFLLFRQRGRYAAPPDQAAFTRPHHSSELPEKTAHPRNVNAVPQQPFELPHDPRIHEMNGR